MAQAIRIQNLYYLFCYAWDHFPDGRAIEAGLTDSPDIVNLFAHILMRGLHRLLRRGLDRGYLETEEDLQTLRGRILISDTIRRNLLLKQQATCSFDELKHDVLHNQIIKATLKTLAETEGLESGLARQLSELDRRLTGVSRINVTSQCFRRVQLSRNNGQYGLLVKVCELVHQCSIPTQNGMRLRFSNVLDDENRMHAIFEKFVRNFYKHELKGMSSVGREIISWDLASETPEHNAYLPRMETDITLRSSSQTTIIDTKYYKHTLSNYRGEKVWSSHLYQLFSYLTNLESRSNLDRNADGILLYPVAGRHLNMSFKGRGHRITVRTINLDQHWSDIRNQLLDIAGVIPREGHT